MFYVRHSGLPISTNDNYCAIHHIQIHISGITYDRLCLFLDLNRYLKKARRCHKVRRDYLDQFLRDQLSNYIYFSLPAGGMAIWVRLKPPFLVNDLLLNCSLEIVRIDETQNAFRFGFASLSENELDQAVSELVKALKKME